MKMIPITYPKIDTLWKRDMKTHRIMDGQYSRPEFNAIRLWSVTEKVHGMNMRISLNIKDKSIEYGGKTDNAEIPESLMNYLMSTFDFDAMKKVFKESEKIVLFGEGYGPKIMKGGGLYRDDASFILFDVWIDGWWLEHNNVKDIAKKLGIQCVPLLGIMSKERIIDLVRSRPRSVFAKKDMVIEGIVARSHPLMLFRNKDPVMWKLKVKDFKEKK